MLGVVVYHQHRKEQLAQDGPKQMISSLMLKKFKATIAGPPRGIVNNPKLFEITEVAPPVDLGFNDDKLEFNQIF